MKNINERSANAIRILAADMIQGAKSGHPGMPLGMADTAYELWANHMIHDHRNPTWENRDRFVLSAGHGSTLLYSLLHLFGYGLTVEDLKNFRQLGSLTPGHPEYRYTAGVDATTGPLGAGLSMSVGMAIAESHLASVFNKPGYDLFDHYTFAICGDGCMMEGISSEALSLAGTLGLGKLIIIYDSNKISIEGSTDIAFTENVQQRVASFGFQTLTVEDGTDFAAIGAAIEEAKKDPRPSFITVKTIIGRGCPAKQGTAGVHGEPLGDENIAELRKTLEWESDERYFVPEDIYANYADKAKTGEAAYDAWKAMQEKYFAEYPEMKDLWDQYYGKITAPESIWEYEDKPEATRVLSGVTLNRIADVIPNIIGGAADLAPSTKTYMKNKGDFSASDRSGRNLHYGVRELAMAGIANGILLHGGLRSFGSTFFVFSDYMKPMLRLAAIMRIPAVAVLTHDSIGVGEDGPTHQPIEQLAMLRAMPNINVWRPCDATECAAAWQSAIESEFTPSVLVMSRQKLPQQPGSSKEALKGGYIVSASKKADPDAIIIAAGSEVATAVDAQKLLADKGVDVRVVSIPCRDVFDAQPAEYRESVLPSAVRARVVVEAAAAFGWGDYAGLDGEIVAMRSFGESGPANKVFDKFGFTAENVAEVTAAVAAKK